MPEPLYQIKEADALGERSNLDMFVDRKAHIIWIRKGMNPADERRAMFAAGRIVQLESPTPVDVPPRDIQVRGHVT